MKIKKKYPHAKVIMVIGGTNSGKTYFINDTIKKIGIRPFAYDLLEDYPTKLPFDTETKDIKIFLKEARQKSNCIIVLEELTSEFNHNVSNMDLNRLMTQSKHKNNLVFLVFHSLMSMPVRLMSLCDNIVLLKTGDRKGFVEHKFKYSPNIVEAYNKIQISPKYTKAIIYTKQPDKKIQIVK